MNTILTDFRFFIEMDANPFLIFDTNANVKYLNESAEFMLKSENLSEIYDLALTYAPQNFGSKNTIIDLNISGHEFYAINVLYQNDDEIGIFLYLKPSGNTKQNIELDGFTKTDINVILQANLELFKINSDAKISLFCDMDIPPFQLHQNNLSLLLKKTLDSFKDISELYISLKYKIGEKITIDKKRYNIIVLCIKSSQMIKDLDKKDILNKANKNYINFYHNENKIIFEIPLID